MGKERLKEITLDIINIEDPLSVLLYMSEMSPSDVQLFTKYLTSSKYKGMDYYTAAITFSYDYLISINYPIPENKKRFTGKSKISI